MTVERTNRSGIKQTGSIHLSNAIDSSIDTDDVSKLTQGGSEDEMPPLSIKNKRRRSVSLDDIARGADVNDPRHPFHHAKEGAQVKAVAIGANMKTRMVILSLVEPLIGCEEENENSGKGRKKRKGDRKIITSSTLPVPTLVQWRGVGAVKQGSTYSCVVVRVEPLAVVVALSPYVQTRLNYADFSSNIEHVRAFKAGAFVGMKLCVFVRQSQHK